MAVAADTLCSLCAEPCPASGPASGPGRSAFCCMGCGNVYSILVESGAIRPGDDPRETDLFKRSLELGLISNARGIPASPRIPADAVVEEQLFHVSGMWCGACGWLIEHVLGREPAIRDVQVFFTSDLLRVRFCPQYLPSGRIEEHLRKLGYAATKHNGQARDNSADRRCELVRVGLAAFLWINVMVLNLSVYLGGTVRQFLPFLVMALAAPVVFYCGFPVLRIGWTGLRAGRPRMETLLALGIVSAYGYSVAQTFLGGNHLYFDIACAIVTLVLLGKHLERNARETATRSITMLYNTLPVKARVFFEGRERFVSLDRLQTGDTFLVRPGERIPADGIVLHGASHVDESLLTGESTPVLKGCGETVTGGSLNTGGVLEVRATAVGDQSVLAQIVQAVEAALGRRSDIERLADKVARVFVPVVMVLAVCVAAGNLLAGIDAGEALMRSITVLVIACPCALGVATPLAVTTAIGAASKKGILIADPRALERLTGIDTVLLDKTGTVTQGRFQLLEGNPDDLRLVAAIERQSEHPLGRAIASEGCSDDPVCDVEILKGMGVRGRVGSNEVFCGNRALLVESALFADAALEARAQAEEIRGHTVVFYGWDGRVKGIFVFGDRIRPEAWTLIDRLHALGIRVGIVSGDAAGTVESVAREIGADFAHAGMLPDSKQRLVARLQSEGRRVVMLGDGVNDGPALAQANLGIAMGTGTDLAMKASNVVLMTTDLTRIVDLFQISVRTLRVIRQNLGWSFVYNLLGISFAASGRLNPILAAGAMVTSSLFVAWNSSRLRK